MQKEVNFVSKFYIKFRAIPTRFPANPEDINKLGCLLCEWTKADLKSGAFKDWGGAPGGQSGYAIAEGVSETELSTTLQKYNSFYYFEITPVLTIDQFVESIGKVARARKSAKK